MNSAPLADSAPLLAQTLVRLVAHLLADHPQRDAPDEIWFAFHDALERNMDLWLLLPLISIEPEPGAQRFVEHRLCLGCGSLMSRPVALQVYYLTEPATPTAPPSPEGAQPSRPTDHE